MSELANSELYRKVQPESEPVKIKAVASRINISNRVILLKYYNKSLQNEKVVTFIFINHIVVILKNSFLELF